MPPIAPFQVQLGRDSANPVCRFAYDGDGNRRKRLDQQGTIHYVFPWYERNVANGAEVGTSETVYYRALGKLVALRKNGVLDWVATDHLGSTTRVLDASFTPVDQQRYQPFGEGRDAATNLQTDVRFTGQTEDSTIGLYWYGSRAYDPVLGRFTSPDTLVPNPYNPQALNRYSYTVNNPLKFVDPSGHAHEPMYPHQVVGDKWMSAKRQDDGSYWYGQYEHMSWGDQFVPYDQILPAGSRALPLAGPQIPDTNILANIAEAYSHRNDRIDVKLRWFYNQVKTGGHWDFKKDGYPEYEEFGNFHYGIVGSAVGFSERVLDNAAGLVQLKERTQQVVDGIDALLALTIRAERQAVDDQITSEEVHTAVQTLTNVKPGYGIPVIAAPYGDDMSDQYWIHQGVVWYEHGF